MSDKNTKNWLRFLIPSGAGVLFFLTPLSIDGQITVGMAWVGDLIIDNWEPQLEQMAGFFICTSVVLTVLFSISRFLRNKLGWLVPQLTMHPFWFSMRLFGAIATLAWFYNMGPEWLRNDATAGTTLGQLIPITMTYLGLGAVFLPLLVDFGLMEFVGVLMSRIFYRVFGLPGRSAIDAMASWMGSGPIGVFITSQQYERGFYTAREAAVICTNFSIVSVSFSLVVINTIGLGHLFMPYYLTVIGIGFLCALITPKLPPLRFVQDTFVDGSMDTRRRGPPRKVWLFPIAIDKALLRASSAPSPKQLLKRIVSNVMDIWLSLIPVVMGLGTLAMILATETAIFDYLGAPIAPLLEAMGLAEASRAAPLLLVGFADMYIPAVVAGNTINSELTRFVVATVSVTQLIYMSEVGALIIRAEIPLGFLHVASVFLLRTVISVPIAVAVGHYLLS